MKHIKGEYMKKKTILESLSLYESDATQELKLLKQLKSLNLSDEELEDAYEMSEAGDDGEIEEAVNKKLAKAATIIGMLASLASAGINGPDDLHRRMDRVSDPIGNAIHRSEVKSQANDALASKVAYLLHPQLVEGDPSKYGHAYTVGNGGNTKSYSLDLGISDNDVDMLKTIEQENPGVLNLALSKALANDEELANQMVDLGMTLSEMAHGAIQGFLK